MYIFYADVRVDLGHVYPESQLTYLHHPLYIRCGSNTLPTWTKNDKELKKSRKFNFLSRFTSGKVVKAHELKIKKVEFKDAGNYTCQGTKEFNNQRVKFTAVAEVFVGGNFRYNTKHVLTHKASLARMHKIKKCVN